MGVRRGCGDRDAPLPTALLLGGAGDTLLPAGPLLEVRSSGRALNTSPVCTNLFSPAPNLPAPPVRTPRIRLARLK